MWEKTIKINDFSLIYEYQKPMKFVRLDFNGNKITEHPLELQRFVILLQAYISNRLPKEMYAVGKNTLVYRERISDQEFLAVKVNQYKKMLNKVDAMEIYAVLEKFISRIDIFEA